MELKKGCQTKSLFVQVWSPNKIILTKKQPCPLSPGTSPVIQNGRSEKPPGQGCQNGSKDFRILSCKHNEMSLFSLKNGFRLQKTNRAARLWKQPPKKPFHVSRDKMLHKSWSISEALARGFSDLPF